jgi:hypothetical protein
MAPSYSLVRPYYACESRIRYVSFSRGAILSTEKTLHIVKVVTHGFGLRIDNLHTSIICCAHMHGSRGLEVSHFRLDVTKTSITSGFWPDVTLDVSLPGGHPSPGGLACARRRASRGAAAEIVALPGVRARISRYV